MQALTVRRMMREERGAGTPGPPAEPTDGELIRAAQKGDHDAFGELVGRYHGRCFWVAKSLVGEEEEARDVTQDAFLRVYRALDRFDFGQNFYTWLYRILVNLAIDRLRRRAKFKPVALDDVGEPAAGPEKAREPSHRLEAGEREVAVREVLAELPEKYRTVMILREFNDLSCKEIADIVGSSHATVRWRLHMARKFFRDAWERRARRLGESGDDDAGASDASGEGEES